MTWPARRSTTSMVFFASAARNTRRPVTSIEKWSIRPSTSGMEMVCTSLRAASFCAAATELKHKNMSVAISFRMRLSSFRKYFFLVFANPWDGNTSADKGYRCGYREPCARHGAIARLVNQVGHDHRRRAANRRRQAVSQGEAGGADGDRHYFGQVHDHCTVVRCINERQPQLNDQQLGERRMVHQPGHRRISREDRSPCGEQQQGTPAHPIRERPHEGQPDEIGYADAKGD